MTRSRVIVLFIFSRRLAEFVGLAFFIIESVVARTWHLLNIFVYDFCSLTAGTYLVSNHGFFYLAVVLVVLSGAWILAIPFLLSTLNSKSNNIFSEVVIISIITRARH